MPWLQEGSLSSCRLSIKACFCPSVIVMPFFGEPGTGVVAGDWRVTICGRAVELVSVEDRAFFVRVGAMTCTRMGGGRNESAARLAITKYKDEVESWNLCKQRSAQGSHWRIYRAWRHRPPHARPSLADTHSTFDLLSCLETKGTSISSLYITRQHGA